MNRYVWLAARHKSLTQPHALLRITAFRWIGFEDFIVYCCKSGIKTYTALNLFNELNKMFSIQFILRQNCIAPHHFGPLGLCNHQHMYLCPSVCVSIHLSITSQYFLIFIFYQHMVLLCLNFEIWGEQHSGLQVAV